MTTKHTPGPWHQKDFATDTPNAPGTEHHASVADIRGNIIAQIALRGTAANDNANARLIAAAPELLAALNKIEGGSFIHSMGPHEVIDRMREIARAAIAKARGAA